MTFTKHFFLFTFEISKASMLLSIEDVWVKTKENSYPVYILTRFLYCLYVESLNTCWWLCNPFLEFSLILEIYFLGVNTFCLVFAFAFFLEVFFRVNSPINKEQRKRWQCQKKMHWTQICWHKCWDSWSQVLKKWQCQKCTELELELIAKPVLFLWRYEG